EALRLRHLLSELPTEGSPDPAAPRHITLSPELRLGQVLVALADADEATPVLVDGDGARRYSAGALRGRILARLRAAHLGPRHRTGPRGSDPARRAGGVSPRRVVSGHTSPKRKRGTFNNPLACASGLCGGFVRQKLASPGADAPGSPEGEP